MITAGTISHGTLRTQDLLRSFAAELSRVSSDDTNLVTEANQNADILDLSPGERNHTIAADVLDDLFRRLDEIALPHGLYFGAHPGDGSDFGYWPPED